METNSRVVIFYTDLLLANSAPKLDGELCNILVFRLHTKNGEAKEGTLHVEAHVIVVETHDSVQATESTLLDARVGGLGSLAHDLHDIVAFSFVSKVVTDELERVAKGSDGSKSNFKVLLLLPCTLDYGCENSIGVADEACSKLGILGFTDVADRGQRRLLLVGSTFTDVLNKDGHQISPLIPGKLDRGDGRDDLGGSSAGLGIRRGESLERKLLNSAFRLIVGLLQPLGLEFLVSGEVSGSEGVLEGNTSSGSDGTLR